VSPKNLKLTVYIPTLRAGERLARTLEALEAQNPRPHIVVADNSKEGLASRLSERFPAVQVLKFKQNLGFGKALNRAIREEPSDLIVFLNDDVTVEPGFVSGLLETMDTGAEMIAAVLLSEQDPSRIDSAGVVADHTLLGFDYLNGESVEALEGAIDPLGPTGGAALFRRADFEAVGGFDERMFLYYEDLDLALRLHQAGVRCRLAPHARGVHAYSETLGARSGAKYEMTGWSRGYMLRAYGYGGRPLLLGRAVAVEVAICIGQMLFERTLRGARGRWRGWRAAREAPPRKVPGEGLMVLSIREALAMRRKRHRG
jgi:N-acetylglucosaminyl-diphospho-decaprenol L-rhamnosyltransferase